VVVAVRIFVASPYAAPTPEGIEANVALARRLCAEVIAAGHSPFAPHLLYPQFLDDSKLDDRARGLRAGIDFLAVCDEVWCWSTVSMGMAHEIREALVRHSKPVRFPWGAEPLDECPVCLRKMVLEGHDPCDCPLCAAARGVRG